MMIWIIYLVTNSANNKVYVGRTVKSMKSRFSAHCSSASKGSNLYFHQAIRKYGFTAFDICELATAQNCEEADKLEQHFIFHYHANNREVGYNLTKGGDGGPGAKSGEANPMFGRDFSKEHRQRLSVAHQGNTPTLDTRKKMSASRCGHVVAVSTRQKLRIQKLGDNNPMKNPATASKIAQTLAGRVQPSELNEKRAATMRQVWASRKGTV